MLDLGGDVRALIAQAQRIAQKNNSSASTGHVLLAMLESRDDTGRLLEARGARAIPFYEALKGVEAEASNALELSIARARRIALQSGSAQVRGLHWLLAMLQNGRSEANRALLGLGVQVEALRRVLEDSLGTPSPDNVAHNAGRVRAEALKPLPRTLIDWEAQKRGQSPEKRAGAGMARVTRQERPERSPARTPLRSAVAPSVEPPAAKAGEYNGGDAGDWQLDPAKFPLLTQLGRNLTLEAFQGRIDPVVGRDREIEQVLDVLARRRANNPILVGPPGVGKTAIAEGLALRLLAETAQGMRGRLLIEVSAGGLVSGTSVRGALSEKHRQAARRSEGGRGARAAVPRRDPRVGGRQRGARRPGERAEGGAGAR